MTENDRTPKTIDDARWVKNKRGTYRLVEDSVDVNTWRSRRREAAGWRNGARVRRP